MNAEADVSPPARLWRHTDRLNPPLPQWIEDLWNLRGQPRLSGSESFAPHAQALLWFATDWHAARVPYRFGLPAELLSWLNSADPGLTGQLSRRPE